MKMKDFFKIKAIEGGLTMAEVVRQINKKFNRNDSLQNLNGKLVRETLKYSEALEIAEILNFEIVWQKKD